MKKALSFFTLVLFAVTAFAEPQLVSLSNKNGKTTVVFTLSSEDKDSNNGLGIDNIILECNDQTYKAKHVDAKFGETTTVFVKFKKIPKMENARLTFNVNGEEKYIDIDKDLID